MFRRTLAVVLLAFALVPAAAAATLSSSESSLLRAMNQARAQHGLRPLRFDTRLESAARSHSRDMVAHDYFAHGAFGTRMQLFHVQGTFAGENLAWGVGSRGSARGIVAAWLASPEHRANLLRPGFRRVGVGEATGTFAGYGGAAVVTADFAGA